MKFDGLSQLKLNIHKFNHHIQNAFKINFYVTNHHFVKSEVEIVPILHV